VSLLSRLLSRQTLLSDRFLYATPAGIGLEADEIEFDASGGLKLRGWLLKGEKAGAIVFCAGNSANVSCHLEYVRLAQRTGHSVIAFDYRGFGRSDGDPDLRPQLFNLAWEVYNGDFESLKTAIGSNPEARASFTQYLFERNRSDDALRLWNSLSEHEKRANRKTGKAIITSLLAAKRFHNAIAIWNDLSPSLTYRAEIGKVLDGGFESELGRASEEPFVWQVKPSSQLQISPDTSKRHSGERSLRLSFQVRSRLNDIGISQLVGVTPATDYDFECYLKTDGLQSGSKPMIQITDAADNAILATSSEAPGGNNDWQQVSLHFKTGEKAEAVIIRIVREPCGEDASCPIYGSIWYDDFNLTRRN